MRNLLLGMGLVLTATSYAGVCEKIPFVLGDDQKFKIAECNVDNENICVVNEVGTENAKLYKADKYSGRGDKIGVFAEGGIHVLIHHMNFCSRKRFIEVPFYGGENCASYETHHWNYNVFIDKMRVKLHFTAKYDHSFKDDVDYTKVGVCTPFKIDMTENLKLLQKSAFLDGTNVITLNEIDSTRKELSITRLNDLGVEKRSYDGLDSKAQLTFSDMNRIATRNLPDDSSIYHGNFHCLVGPDRLSSYAGIAEISFSRSAGSTNDLLLKPFAKVKVVSDFNQDSGQKVLPTKSNQETVYFAGTGQSSVLMADRSSGVEFMAIKYSNKDGMELLTFPSNKVVCFK